MKCLKPTLLLVLGLLQGCHNAYIDTSKAPDWRMHKDPNFSKYDPIDMSKLTRDQQTILKAIVLIEGDHACTPYGKQIGLWMQVSDQKFAYAVDAASNKINIDNRDRGWSRDADGDSLDVHAEASVTPATKANYGVSCVYVKQAGGMAMHMSDVVAEDWVTKDGVIVIRNPQLDIYSRPTKPYYSRITWDRAVQIVGDYNTEKQARATKDAEQYRQLQQLLLKPQSKIALEFIKSKLIDRMDHGEFKDDPDKLLDKVNRELEPYYVEEKKQQEALEVESARLKAISENEDAVAEAKRVKVQAAREAEERRKIASFRKSIKEGDETNCGPAIEVKGKLVKVSFAVANYGNEHWIRRDQSFPVGYSCSFVNGEYQPPL